jgi:hypothetical protein
MSPNGEAAVCRLTRRRSALLQDARVREMLAAARRTGLKPRSDHELLPVLLELLGAHVPVESSPTMAKAKRSDLARDDTRGRAAAADRPTARPLRVVEPRLSKPAAATAPKAAMVVEPRWPQHANAAVDSDRRHRREQTLEQAPSHHPPRTTGCRTDWPARRTDQELDAARAANRELFANMNKRH